MIEPNFNVLLWIMLFSWVIQGIKGIIYGALKEKKQIYYDEYDIFAGIITLIIVTIVLIT